jgi:pimeloyl-ACP methyl ester carboxylesterase
MAETFEIAVDNARIRGEFAGFGVPVVFLHAGVADRRMWADQMRALPAEGYHAVAYDRRGFGETETPDEPFSHAVDLEAVLDRLGLNAVVLVGCSMGGALAIDFALEHPGRVVALVLVATAVSGAQVEVPEEVAEIEEQIEYADESGNVSRVNRLEARLWLDGPTSPEGRVEGPVRDLFLDMNGIALGHPPLTQEDKPDSAMDHLSLIAVPVLLVAGALDGADILELHDELAEALPDAFAVTIDDAAHLPSLEQPDAFNEVLLEFLDAVTARGASGEG